MAFDFKKVFKEFYMPKNKPEIVNVPKANYIAVRGKGNPNEEGGAYQQAISILYAVAYTLKMSCNGVQREHNKKLNNGLPILHKVPPKRDYGRYFCIMAEKGGTSHGGLTEKLSPFFHAKKQEVNAYGR